MVKVRPISVWEGTDFGWSVDCPWGCQSTDSGKNEDPVEASRLSCGGGQLRPKQSTDGSDSRLIGAGSEDSEGLNQSAEQRN